MTALRKNKQTTHEIGLSGQPALLDLTGAMYLADHDALLVADLHFEKGSSFARRGMMLPPYDTRETLAALREAVFRFDPRMVVALGDSFHDVGGPDRLGEEERQARILESIARNGDRVHRPTAVSAEHRAFGQRRPA